MDQPQPLAIDGHRADIAQAREALAVLHESLFQVQGTDLSALAREIDDLLTVAGGARIEVIREAKSRGVVKDAGQNTRGWVLEYCPSTRQGTAGQIASFVDRLSARTSGLSGQLGLDDADPGDPWSIVWSRVRTGEVGAPLGLAALTEVDKIADRVVEEMIPTVTTGLLDIGVVHGQSAMRDLKIHLLARYGRPDQDEVEEDQRRLRRHAFLSSPDPESGDLTRYRLALTPEQAARFEAAIGPLAAPQPDPANGTVDPRSNGQRRAEALLDLCSRAQSADAEDLRGPAAADTAVLVTVSLDDLRQLKGAGEVLRSRAGGLRLGIETLRKLSCDADLIPVVLGTDSQTLDHGMVRRLFSRAQRRALALRDRHCTFPGCTAPAAWTKVHHIRHWCDDGPTDLDNAALLCQRHHTYVHDKRLWAEVRSCPDEGGRSVFWDVVPGSYDRALAKIRSDALLDAA